ncbi:MAG TPA: type II CAAX endopeptidase family protein [Thermoanaerobaculia bacterium]
MRLQDRWGRRIGALLELVGVFVTGTLVARMIAGASGLASGGLRDAQPGAAVDYLALAFTTAANLLLRYGLILGLAFVLGWRYGRRRWSSYGVSLADVPVRTHIAIGVVLFAVGGFLPKLLVCLKDRVPLGAGPRHWDLIATADSFEFWVYMAVGSFGLVPIVEELFFRGYVQTRLSEPFGVPAAIVMTALLFTLSHRQYFIASVLGGGMLLALFLASLLAGYARYRFDSLVPAIIAHSLGNVPVRGALQLVLLVLMAIVAGVAWRAVIAHARELTALLRTRAVLAGSLVTVAVVVVVLSIAALGRVPLIVFGGLALIAGVALARRERPGSTAPRHTPV